MTEVLRLAAAALGLLVVQRSTAQAQLVPARTTGYVTVDSSRLYYEECGTGF